MAKNVAEKAKAQEEFLIAGDVVAYYPNGNPDDRQLGAFVAEVHDQERLTLSVVYPGGDNVPCEMVARQNVWHISAADRETSKLQRGKTGTWEKLSEARERHYQRAVTARQRAKQMDAERQARDERLKADAELLHDQISELWAQGRSGVEIAEKLTGGNVERVLSHIRQIRGKIPMELARTN